MNQEETLLARQPIFDTSLNVFAYELLFRPSSGNVGEIDGDQATSLVMLNAFTEIGIHSVVGQRKAFINFTHNLILSPPPLANEEVVIEVLENIQPTPEIIAGLKALKAEGYTIALDDFIYHDSLLPLVEIADIIKVDVLPLSLQELEEHVSLLKTKKVKLLAEKVETLEMFETCKALGFDYFQGYFLSKPKLVSGRKIAANKLVVMQLLNDLQRPDIEPKKLHETLSRDPSLSFKLLRLINSAAYHRSKKIESLYQAILMIGLNHIKRWGSLLALSSLDEKPGALHEQTMLRAKMCELLGQKLNPPQADIFYTVGMMSMLESYFERPLRELLDSISLSDEINQALIEHSGAPGFALKICKAYELGQFGDIDWHELQDYQVSIRDLKNCYLESVQWLEESGRTMLGTE